MSSIMLETIFYIFALLMVIGALLVITLKNPVHSVLFLIFVFFNAAGLFIILGAEYLAMTLIIVYVGAVAVLFLFVVMMLDINISKIKQGFSKTLPLGLALGFLTFLQMYMVLQNASTLAAEPDAIMTDILLSANNTKEIGKILYTEHIFAFQMCGVLLLIAMIGAILLALTTHAKAKHQDIAKQVHRTKEQSIELVKVKIGQGVKI